MSQAGDDDLSIVDGARRTNELSSDEYRELQLVLLKRLWEVIDQVKALRSSIPFTVTTILLAITGLILTNDELPSSRFQAIAIPTVIATIALVSLLMFWSIHTVYNTIFRQIDYLYGEIGMDGEHFFPTYHKAGSNPKWFFISVYLLLAIVGLACTLSTALDGVR